MKIVWEASKVVKNMRNFLYFVYSMSWGDAGWKRADGSVGYGAGTARNVTGSSFGSANSILIISSDDHNHDG